VISDCTEDSVRFTTNVVIKGLAGIREFFDLAIKGMSPDLMKSFTMIRQDVEGETAYILWKAEPFIPLSTDTLWCVKGK
jgi:nitrogen regulatory protein PII-like uncharacterized protein